MISALRSHQEDLEVETLHVAERIANTIIECLYIKGTWELKDLKNANYSDAELSRYLAEACRIAEKRPRPS